MKKLLLSVIVILTSTFAYAQSNVDDIVNNFRGRDDVNVVSISGAMFKLGSDFIEETDEDSKMAKNIASQIEQMNIVNAESKESSEELKKLVSKLIKKGTYDEMMTVDSEGQEVKFYGKIENKVIKEFFIFVEENSDSTLISMMGDIDPKSVNKLLIKANVN